MYQRFTDRFVGESFGLSRSEIFNGLDNNVLAAGLYVLKVSAKLSGLSVGHDDDSWKIIFSNNEDEVSKMKNGFGYFNTFRRPLSISILQIIGFQALDSYVEIIAQWLIKSPSKFPRSEQSEHL